MQYLPTVSIITVEAESLTLLCLLALGPWSGALLELSCSLAVCFHRPPAFFSSFWNDFGVLKSHSSVATGNSGPQSRMRPGTSPATLRAGIVRGLTRGSVAVGRPTAPRTAGSTPRTSCCACAASLPTSTTALPTTVFPVCATWCPCSALPMGWCMFS